MGEEDGGIFFNICTREDVHKSRRLQDLKQIEEHAKHTW